MLIMHQPSMLFTDLDRGGFGVQPNHYAKQFLMVTVLEAYAGSNLQSAAGNPGSLRLGLNRCINILQIEVIKRDVPVFLVF